MAKILTFDPIEDCVRDVLSILEKETFEEVVLVGMHGWIRYIARGIWLQGYRFEKVLTNTDSRWSQEHEDIDGHKFTCVPFEAAGEIGDRAVYIIANTHGDELTKQLAALGCSPERVLILPEGKYYVKNAKKHMMESYGSKMEPMSHKEVQAALLNLLCEFRKICDENGLSYFLSDGTLLGAARHQGFLPWDNDLDVAMPIDDYRRLKELYVSDGRYELIDYTDYPELKRWFPVFVDNNFHIYDASYGNVAPLHLDVFPILGCGSDFQEAMQRKKEIGKLHEACNIYSHTRIFDKANRLSDSMQKLWRSTPDSQLLTIPYTNGRVCGLYEREWYQDYTEITFEGETFHAPYKYEKVLFMTYGTYKGVPPVECRTGYPLNYFKMREI